MAVDQDLHQTISTELDRAEQAALTRRRLHAATKDTAPDRRPTCAVYLRISRDPDGTSTATSRQLEDCRRFAELRGWDIVAVFEDPDVSAYKQGVVRKDYERLLAALQAGEFDVVLVWRLDRLVRRVVEFARFWSIAEAHQVRLAAATQPIDTSDPIGMLIVNILVAFAEMESATMSVRIQRVQDEMATNGRSKRSGHRPFGLTKDWSRVVPEEADVIREVAGRLLAGESVGPIINDLNDRGVAPVAAERWTRRSLIRMMQSGRVFGWRENHGDLTAKGDWPAILDEATGRAVRDLIQQRSTPSGARKHLLSGILRCQRCNARLRANVGSDGSRRYVCPPRADGGCSGISIRADAADTDVEAMVLDRLASPETAAALRARRDRNAGSTEAEVLAELADLARQTDENARLRTAGELPRAAWLAAERAIEARTDQLNGRLSDLRRDDPLAEIGDGAGIEARYRALSVRRRRAVVQAVVDRIVVHGKDSDYYLAHLRVALAGEADKMDARVVELRRRAAELDGRLTRYERIAERFRAEIRAGHLVAGDRLPTQAEIRAEEGASVATVAAAVERLKAEGLVSTSPQGAFVTDGAAHRAGQAPPPAAADPVEARRLRAEATELAKAASRRRGQARDGTGGGRWRAERLEPIWRV